MKQRSASTAQAAISMPSSIRCGRALKIVAVLEGARLALVAIDRQVARAGARRARSPISGPTGKPAPPRPRSPAASRSSCTSSPVAIAAQLRDGLIAAIAAR